MGSLFSYDLISDLRKNPKQMAAVTSLLGRIDSITAAVRNGKGSREDLQQAMADIVPASGFNFGLLIPQFFPRYPLDEPLDFSNRPFMFAMTCLAPGSVLTLNAGRQVGKCADGDTEVTTLEGPRTLASLFEDGLTV